SEQLPAVDRNDFVDAVAEDEATVEHRHLGLGERQVLAVQVAEGLGKMGLHGASEAIVALPGLGFGLHLSQRRMASQARANTPLCSTGSITTSGTSAIALPAAVETTILPTRWPLARGATRGSLRSTLVCSL